MFNIYVQEQSGIFMGNYASIQLMGKWNVILNFNIYVQLYMSDFLKII